MAVKFTPGEYAPRDWQELSRNVKLKLREFADVFNVHTGDLSIHYKLIAGEGVTLEQEGDETTISTTSGSGGFTAGMIQIWSGAIADIPTGWQLCDGTNNTPDLRDKFILGAGNNYDPDDTGGSDNYTRTSSPHNGHTHTTLGAGAHTHSGQTGGPSGTVPAASGTGQLPGGNHTHGFTTNSAGDHSHSVLTGGAHSHTVDTTPNYYALAYIIYTGAGSGGGAGLLWVDEVQENFQVFAPTTSGATWTTFHTVTLSNGDAFRGRIVAKARRTGGNSGGDPVYRAERTFVLFHDGSADCDDTQLYEDGNGQLGTRVRSSGDDIIFEVRGRNNQDWDWRVTVFNREFPI